MPGSLALSFWLILLLALLWFDPAKESKTSPALWIPVVWMFIVGSRLTSQWFGGPMGQVEQALEEGNPLDRSVYFALILLATVVLISRTFRWGDFFSRNWALTVFLCYALLSVLWSDFPWIAFKRWFRDLGNYLVILVALSDRRPLEAVCAVLRRVSFLLVPLSVVLIKYYPQLGRQYSFYTGADMYVGVTTGKNLLGVVCLVSGLFFFWDTVTRWPKRRQRRAKWTILVNIAFIAMTLWLLRLANTVTSDVCLAFGSFLIVAARSKYFKRHITFLKVLVPACFCLYLILAFVFDIGGQLAGYVGKDPTLTNRTEIWNLVLNMHTNPLIGTGYESFWLGPRLKWFWAQGMGAINEAHNGFLEMYLNLGLIGILLVAAFLIASYRTIWKRRSPVAGLRSLALALWIAFLFYNVTEAGFRSGLMWLTFLLANIAVPVYGKHPIREVSPFGVAPPGAPTPDIALEASHRESGQLSAYEFHASRLPS